MDIFIKGRDRPPRIRLIPPRPSEVYNRQWPVLIVSSEENVVTIDALSKRLNSRTIKNVSCRKLFEEFLNQSSSILAHRDPRMKPHQVYISAVH